MRNRFIEADVFFEITDTLKFDKESTADFQLNEEDEQIQILFDEGLVILDLEDEHVDMLADFTYKLQNKDGS